MTPYPYDPNVRFDWPEVDPTQGSTSPCLPGQYVGQFDCTMTGVPFIGPISFNLQPSLHGEFLEIDNGRFEASWVGVQFGGDLVGELECTTNAFHADVLDGRVAGVSPFSGTLDGALDRSIQTLSGTWALSNAGSTCSGSWSAVRQP